MHTLLIAGTPEQLETYLRPLAEGRTRSCFAMTEPDVASSDPTNLETTAVRDGDDWVLNGRKWCITGARGRGVRDRRREDRHRRLGGAPQLLADPRAHRHARLAHRAPSGVDGLALARRAPGDRAGGRAGAARQPARRRGRGLQDRAAAARRRAARARDALDRRRPARARPLLAAAAHAQGVRQGARPPPGPPVHARRLGDGPLREPADGAAHGLEGRAGPAAPAGGGDDEDVRVRGVRADRRPGGADARRRGHRDGPPDLAHLPGRPRRADLRRRERGPPDGDRARHAQARAGGRLGARAPAGRCDRGRRHRPHAGPTPARGSRCSSSTRCSPSSTRTGWGRGSRRSRRSATATPTSRSR